MDSSIIASKFFNFNDTAKKQLYFAKGAREVWLCNQQGKMSFFNAQQELEKSVLMPDFPQVIDIEFFKG
jgi:hypothetical protein